METNQIQDKVEIDQLINKLGLFQQVGNLA